MPDSAPAPTKVITTWEAVIHRTDGTVEDLGEIARREDPLPGHELESPDA